MRIQPIVSYSTNSYTAKENKLGNNLTFEGVKTIKTLKNSNLQRGLKTFFTKFFAPKNAELATKLPIVATPILFYDMRNYHLQKLLDGMKEAGVEIPRRFSSSPVSDSGLDEMSKQAFRKNINEAARNHQIDEEIKNELLHRITFTGSPEESSTKFVDGDLDVDIDADVSEGAEGFFEAVGDFFDNIFG